MRHASHKFKILFTLFALLSFIIGCSEGGDTTPDPDTPDDPAAPMAVVQRRPDQRRAPPCPSASTPLPKHRPRWRRELRLEFRRRCRG